MVDNKGILGFGIIPTIQEKTQKIMNRVQERLRM